MTTATMKSAIANEQTVYHASTQTNPGGFVEFNIHKTPEENSLDAVRLMLNEALLSEEYSQILMNKMKVEDGKYYVGAHEIKQGIEALHGNKVIHFILECYHTSTLVEICNKLGYVQCHKQTCINVGAGHPENRQIVFVKDSDKSDVIVSKIYSKEIKTQENTEPEYLSRCLKHIAMTAWLRSRLKHKVELILFLLTNAPAIRNRTINQNHVGMKPENSLWLLRIMVDGNFTSFMEKAGYHDISSNYINGMTAWESKPFAYTTCNWMFGNFIHSNPISIINSVYSNDVDSINLLIMVNLWRRLQATPGATKDVLMRMGYKFHVNK